MLLTLAAPATLGLLAVTFGWTPADTNANPNPPRGYEYLIQVSPADLEALRDGRADELTSELPAEVGPIERVRVYVDSSPAPRRLTEADARSPRRIAATPEGRRYTVAKPVAPPWGDATEIASGGVSTAERREVFQNPPAVLRGLQEGAERFAEDAGSALRNSADQLNNTIEQGADRTRRRLEEMNPFRNRPRAGDTPSSILRPEPTRGAAAPLPDSPWGGDRMAADPDPAARPDSFGGSESRSLQPNPSTTDRGPSRPQGNPLVDPRDAPFAAEERRAPRPPIPRADSWDPDFVGANDGYRPYREDLEPLGRQREERVAAFKDLDGDGEERVSEAANRRQSQDSDESLGNFADDQRNQRTESTTTGWGDGAQEESTGASTDRRPMDQALLNLLLVGVGGAAMFLWIAHMELRAKYRALLRNSPGGGYAQAG